MFHMCQCLYIWAVSVVLLKQMITVTSAAAAASSSANHIDAHIMNPFNSFDSLNNMTFFNTSWVSEYFSNVTTKISNLFTPKKAPKKRETRQIPQARLSYINGIFHSPQDCDEIVEQVESIFKLKVNAYYLPSTGSWVQDVSKAGMILFTKPGNSELVRGLTAHLRRLLNETAPDGRVLHIAHSAGAIITYLAAKHHLSYEEKRRIDVVTLGGGRSITKKYFPGRLVNYYSQNDPLTIVDSRAGSMLRRGKKLLRSMLYSSSKTAKESEKSNGDDKSDIGNSSASRLDMKNNITKGDTSKSKTASGGGSSSESEELSEMFAELQEVTEQKHNTSFVFLRGLAKHPVIDHRANGPTYLIALKREARTFRRQLRETLYLEARNRSSVRLVRKQFSKITGQRHFWSRLLQGNITLLPASGVLRRDANESSVASSSWTLPSFNWTTLSLTGNRGHASASLVVDVNGTVWPSVRSMRKMCARWTGQSHFWSRRHNASTVESSKPSSSSSSEVAGEPPPSVNQSIDPPSHAPDTPSFDQVDSSSNDTLIPENLDTVDAGGAEVEIDLETVETTEMIEMPQNDENSKATVASDSEEMKVGIDSIKDRTESDMTGYYLP